MALIPNRIVRISMAYKLSVIIAFAMAFCCFFWDLYTHELLEETQDKLEQSLKNQETLLRFVELEIVNKRCLD